MNNWIAKHTKLLKPFNNSINSLFRKPCDWLKKSLTVEFFHLLASLCVLVSAFTYVCSEQQRRNTEVYQAWQVVTAAYNQPGSGGRKEALEFLNDEPMRVPLIWGKWERQSLARLAAPKAFLYKIKLPHARLSGADLQEADLSEGDLHGADFWRANLQQAILTEANLQGAGLQGANLQGANLADADLSGADLKEANLKGAIYTDENTRKEVCQKYLLIEKDYPCHTKFPEGFNPKVAGMELFKK